MKKILLASVLTLFMSPIVSAHTIALGTTNAGAAGSVTLWLGSYHSPAQNGPTEGSMTLNGVTQAFAIASSTLPAGLVAGVNYFYAGANSGNGGNFDQIANNTGLAEIRWQGVTFTGLAAGTYAYSITGMFTAVWADWNTLTSNWTGMLEIPESSVMPTPEPGMLALFGIGLAGIGLARRRRQRSL